MWHTHQPNGAWSALLFWVTQQCLLLLSRGSKFWILTLLRWICKLLISLGVFCYFFFPDSLILISYLHLQIRQGSHTRFNSEFQCFITQAQRSLIHWRNLGFVHFGNHELRDSQFISIPGFPIKNVSNFTVSTL